MDNRRKVLIILIISALMFIASCLYMAIKSSQNAALPISEVSIASTESKGIYMLDKSSQAKGNLDESNENKDINYKLLDRTPLNEQTDKDNQPDSIEIKMETQETLKEMKVAPTEDKEDHSTENTVTVYLDPGHGGDAASITEYNGEEYERAASGAAIEGYPANSLGTTSGTGADGINECDAVYDICEVVKTKLEQAGYNVAMSRDDVHPASEGGGSAIGNWERGRRASGYDFWVVLHADGGGGSGFHCVSYDSDRTRHSVIGDSFIAAMEAYGRPVYTAGGYVHGWSGNSSGTLQAPTKYIEHGGDPDNMLYIEAGFMDNPSDLEYMTSEKGKEEIAYAIVQALNTVAELQERR